MVTKTDNAVNFFLTDISETDKPWDTHKTESVHIANALCQNRDFLKRGLNLNRCAEWLVYEATNNPDKPLRLSDANFCRDRACSTCVWRRTLRWLATLYKQLPGVHEKYPYHRWLFLTLTVKNCEISELKSTIQAMNKGFQSLFRKLKKKFPTIGYIRTTEVTRGKDDTAHPHYHVMLFVPSDYFRGRGYITQMEWVRLWQESMKLDYYPVVDIRVVKPKKNSKISSNKFYASAIVEVMKYSIKVSDLIKPTLNGDYGWTYEYLRQVTNLRFISIGGILKGLIKAEWQSKDEKNQDLVHTGLEEESLSENDKDNTEIYFHFDRYVWRYKC